MLNVLMCISVALVVLTAVYTLFFHRDDAFLFGVKPFMISSESMEPTHKKYAVVIVQNNSYDDVKVGDLIAFRADPLGGKPAFHRVMEVTPDGFVTKGDANRINDDQIVNREAYLGREIWYTNFLGTLIPLLQTPKGLLSLVILPALLIIILIVSIKILKSLRKPVEGKKKWKMEN